MAFNSNDQSTLVDLLGLDREQLSTGSRLKALMDDVENFDEVEGTNVVLQIQTLMSEISTLNTTIEGLEDTGTGTESMVSVPNEIMIQRNLGQYQYTGILNRRKAKLQRLKSLLDLNNTLGEVTPGGNILF